MFLEEADLNREPMANDRPEAAGVDARRRGPNFTKSCDDSRSFGDQPTPTLDLEIAAKVLSPHH